MAFHIDPRVLPFIIAAAATFGANALIAQAAFEGVFTMKMSGVGNSASQTIKYSVKNGVMRMEMEGKDGGKGYTTTDPRKEVTYMVVPAPRMYVEMAADPKAAERIRKSEPKITKTGRQRR